MSSEFERSLARLQSDPTSGLNLYQPPQPSQSSAYQVRRAAELARTALEGNGTLLVYCERKLKELDISANLYTDGDNLYLRSYYAHFRQVQQDSRPILVAVFPNIPAGNYELSYSENEYQVSNKTWVTVFPDFTVEMTWPASHTEPT